MRAALFALLLLPAPALAQGTGPDLTPLLAGFERCKANAAFEAFEKSLVARYSNNFDAKTARNDARVSIVVPPALRDAVSPATPKLNPDHTLVTVPMKGHFQGFGVERVVFAFGNENGIAVRSLVFAGPVAPVKAKFAKGLAAAKRAQGTEGAEVNFAVLPKPPATILCDFSN